LVTWGFTNNSSSTALALVNQPHLDRFGDSNECYDDSNECYGAAAMAIPLTPFWLAVCEANFVGFKFF
jgi:hypothetical protein